MVHAALTQTAAHVRYRIDSVTVSLFLLRFHTGGGVDSIMAQMTFVSFRETMDSILKEIGLNGGWSIPDDELSKEYDNIPTTEWPDDVVEMAVNQTYFANKKPGYVFTTDDYRGGSVAGPMMSELEADLNRAYGYVGGDRILVACTGQFVPGEGVYWDVTIDGVHADPDVIKRSLRRMGIEEFDESSVVVSYEE